MVFRRGSLKPCEIPISRLAVPIGASIRRRAEETVCIPAAIEVAGIAGGRTVHDLCIVRVAQLIENIPPGTRTLYVENEIILEISGVHELETHALFQVAEAGRPAPAFPRLVQRRQQHRRQNGDDGYHDEELDKSESFSLFHFYFSCCFRFRADMQLVEPISKTLFFLLITRILVH